MTEAKNAFVGWALNFRVRMLLKDAVTDKINQVSEILYIWRVANWSAVAENTDDLESSSKRSQIDGMYRGCFGLWFSFKESAFEKLSPKQKILLQLQTTQRPEVRHQLLNCSHSFSQLFLVQDISWYAYWYQFWILSQRNVLKKTFTPNWILKKRFNARLYKQRVFWNKSQKSEAPNVGLEPTTLRLRVSCSTDWASRARYAGGKYKNQNNSSRNKNTDHASVIFVLLIFTPLAKKPFYMRIKEDFLFKKCYCITCRIPYDREKWTRLGVHRSQRARCISK